MVARNREEWEKVPSQLKAGEWVDSRIYSDQKLHEEELEKIWKKAWIPVCHESELANPYDFRTLTIANEPIIITRDKDMEVRAFLNVCPHRGNLIERRPSGSFKKGTPSGTPKRMTCMFHAWQFDMKGKCVYISRQDEGYQDRLCTSEVGLRQLRERGDLVQATKAALKFKYKPKVIDGVPVETAGVQNKITFELVED